MFIKTNTDGYINLNMYHQLIIEELNEDGPEGKKYDCSLVLYFNKDYTILAKTASRVEAEEIMNEIIEAHRTGITYLELDPRGKFNVKLKGKWVTDEPIHAYAKAIEILGLEKIEERKLKFKDDYCEIVSKEFDPKLKQMRAGDYYIVASDRVTTMKETLEYIASELGVEIKVTIY